MAVTGAVFEAGNPGLSGGEAEEPRLLVLTEQAVDVSVASAVAHTTLSQAK